MRRSQRRIIPLAIAAGLCTVAIIWSVRAAPGARSHTTSDKMPSVYTVGDRDAPTGLTAAEMRKRSTAAPRNAEPTNPALATPSPAMRRSLPRETIGRAETVGLTPAERQKLKRSRERAAASSSPPAKSEVSTVDTAQRAPGYDGMTSAEKAKWQRHIAGKEGADHENR